MQVEYHNGTGLLCVIGDPIGHSLSPLLQNTMLKELGEDYLYLALPVKAGTVEQFVSAAKAIGIRGFNLTMPHKEHILPYLSRMTPALRLRQYRPHHRRPAGGTFHRWAWLSQEPRDLWP